MLLKKNWVLELSFIYLVLVDPMDRSLIFIQRLKHENRTCQLSESYICIPKIELFRKKHKLGKLASNCLVSVKR